MRWGRRCVGVVLVALSGSGLGACQLFFPLDESPRADAAGSGQPDVAHAHDSTMPDAGRDAPGESGGHDAHLGDAAGHDAHDAAIVDAHILDVLLDHATCASQTDAQNCGACGHSCLGGACSGGACQPVELAESLIYAGVVRAGGRGVVYYTTTANPYAPVGSYLGSAVSVFSPDAGVSEALPGAPRVSTGYYGALAVGGGRVYFMRDFSAILAYDVDTGVITTFASGGEDAGVFPVLMAADDTNVYWYGYGAVQEQPTDSGVHVQVASGISAGLGGMTAGRGRVWWTAPPNQVVYQQTPGGVMSGGTTAENPGGITVDDAGVPYWVALGSGDAGGSVQSYQSGAVVTVAVGQVAPSDIWVDAKYIYWLNGGTGAHAFKDGTVMRLPKNPDAGAPIAVASAQIWPVSITGDDQAIYWLNAGNPDAGTGSLWKLAK